MAAFHAILFAITIQIANVHSSGNWPRSDVKDNHFERIMEGQDITLKCAGRNTNAMAHWDYKPCRSGFNEIVCSNVINDEDNPPWQPLSHNKSTLTLKSVKQRQSGLYRCRQLATSRIYIYYTIQLEILTYHDDSLPMFLDDLPKNVTVHKNAQAVFQCKVWSNTPPDILWFWQSDAPGAFRHSGKWYAPVGDGEMASAGGARIAKLVLPHAKAQHTGRYFCVAVNTRGFTNRSAYLNVISEEDEWHEASHLYVLYLLPFGLAFIPITIWLCFLYARRKRLKSENKHLDFTPMNCDETVSL